MPERRTNVDHFIACSHYIARRIRKVYRRDATVIYPNVSIGEFALCEHKKDYYVTCSRVVPYKKINIIVEAFTTMPDRRLVVIGDGPQLKDLTKIATPKHLASWRTAAQRAS